MTDYTATPEQWADAEYYGNPERQPRPISGYACILELRARIEALEVVRPKPPTLNSIALQMLGTIERDAHYLPEITDTIRKALEALSND